MHEKEIFNYLQEPSERELLLLKYMKDKLDIYICCVWPSRLCNYYDIIKNIIDGQYDLIYTKDIKFHFNAFFRFIISIYVADPWISKVNDCFSDARLFSKERYDNDNFLGILVFRADESYMTICSNIRNQLIEDDSFAFEIFDSRDSGRVADIVFNRNSLDVLVNCKPEKNIRLINRINEFRKRVSMSGFNLEEFIIDSSSVLGIYNLRRPRDIDFLTLLEDTSQIEDSYISRHTMELEFHSKKIEDLLYQPENHLVFYGVKFITLDILKEFKAARGEVKDKLDVKIITQYQQKGITIKIKFYQLVLKFYYAFAGLKRMVCRFRNFVKRVLLSIRMPD